MNRTYLKKSGQSETAKLKKKLDIAFSKMIRERDKGKPCIDLCGRNGTKQAGHFRRRELMSTRWDYRNVNGQNQYCNCWDNDGFRHAKGIDKKWGHGTADKLNAISQKVKQWSVKELQELIAAAKKGYEVYCVIYDSIKI